MATFNYYTFPQPLVGVRDDFKESLEHALSWMIVDYSRRWDEGEFENEEIDPYEARRKKLIRDASFDSYLEPGYKSKIKGGYEGLLVAADMFNVKLGDPIYGAKRAEVCRKYLDKMPPAPMVSIQRTVFWEMLRGEFRENEGRVLIGVRSILGTSPYKRITLDFIRWRANGGSGRIWQRGNVRPLLSVKQVRTALDSLENRNFFRSITFNNRYRYFSAKMTNEQLQTSVQNLVNRKRKAKRKTCRI